MIKSTVNEEMVAQAVDTARLLSSLVVRLQGAWIGTHDYSPTSVREGYLGAFLIS
jgi:hypothetical protein